MYWTAAVPALEVFASEERQARALFLLTWPKEEVVAKMWMVRVVLTPMKERRVAVEVRVVVEVPVDVIEGPGRREHLHGSWSQSGPILEIRALCKKEKSELGQEAANDGTN